MKDCYLDIENFKCFQDISIPINGLTVLAGVNGNGKSSIVQALLLLRQAIELNFTIENDFYQWGEMLKKELPLNGVYELNLGNSSHIFNNQAHDDKIILGIHTEESEFTIECEADSTSSKLFLDINTNYDKEGEKEELLLFHREFHYLVAERIGPRIQHSIKTLNFPNTGNKGELTAQLISMKSGYKKVDSLRFFPQTKISDIEKQVNYWLDYIMPGIRVKASQDIMSMSSKILLENDFTRNDPTISTNLGFGVSYVLPIIATGLVAKKGSVFIVENPEAHLHPSAQSKIARFLAMVAKAGINVIIETHSDHIISGIQLAVANNDIDNELVTINYLNKEESSFQPEVIPIQLTEKAELKQWPKGFFDQTQVDYAELLSLRQK